jgi:outer membrane lipoprotein carrier protein
MRFKTPLVLLATLYAALFLSAANANQKAADDLNALLQRFKTYQANYAQVTTDGSDHILQKSSGKMMIRRPGGFRWETNEPTHQVIITDGKSLWIYDVDLMQATKQALKKQVRINPAALLSGSIKDMATQFSIAETNKGNVVAFTLTPKKEEYGFKSLVLTFDHKVLNKMVTINSLDQHSTFLFTQIKLNKTLPLSIFQFKEAPGIDIIEQ